MPRSKIVLPIVKGLVKELDRCSKPPKARTEAQKEATRKNYPLMVKARQKKLSAMKNSKKGKGYRSPAQKRADNEKRNW